MKGIILAGGSGSRLFPSTLAVNKQLFPIYDKPTIYYPLSQLILAGIREILIICAPNDLDVLKRLLGDGKNLGLSLTYKVQRLPEGIAQAFQIADDFIADSSVCLILGDNIFYGDDINVKMSNSVPMKDGAIVFAYQVTDPERYGVIEIDNNQKTISIEEKPKAPKSSFAVTGLYFYGNEVVDYAKNLKKSARGEFEISELNSIFLKQNKLKVHVLDSSVTWLDTGTNESMLESSLFVQTVQKRKGISIGCIEEAALKKNYISKEQLRSLAIHYPNNNYGDYVKRLADLK